MVLNNVSDLYNWNNNFINFQDFKFLFLCKLNLAPFSTVCIILSNTSKGNKITQNQTKQNIIVCYLQIREDLHFLNPAFNNWPGFNLWLKLLLLLLC